MGRRDSTKKAGGLRTGFSTGTAAAAAAKAALQALLTGRIPESVTVSLPQGGRIDIPVSRVVVRDGGIAEAGVVKDAGDDPDVTNKALIMVTVRLLSPEGEPEIRILGGRGVGRVTRPGLPIPVGEPAINPVPREMLKKSLRQAWSLHGLTDANLRVEAVISVPDGEKLARRTLNPRLGITGGISILGTTGLVKPFSHEAYTATIDSALDVAVAAGLTEVVFTTGGKSEKIAMTMRPDLPDVAFIQIADFFGYALEAAARRPLKRIGVVSFFGKSVKQAQGLYYTHAHQAPMDLAALAEWFLQVGADPGLCEDIRQANTARHALDILKTNAALRLIREVGCRLDAACRKLAGPELGVWTRIVDFDATLLYPDVNHE